MLKPTVPFSDRVSGHPEEPSLRIGTSVPPDAVNIAYYYNPVATDAEKVLTAEAPRNTIDHRVEEAYRYLFDQASDDDDLFPGFVWYEDEEGYSGRLGRMYVRWHEEAHVLTKNVQQTKEIITTDKTGLPKMYEYSDDAGYAGNLYLDTETFEVTKTKDKTTVEEVDREVNDFELSYDDMFGSGLLASSVDTWMKMPVTGVSMWPQSITVSLSGCSASSGNAGVLSYINSLPNVFDEAEGYLVFDRFEYEPVAGGISYSESVGGESFDINGVLKIPGMPYGSPPPYVPVTGGVPDATALAELETYKRNIEAHVAACKMSAMSILKSSYCAKFVDTTGTYDYTPVLEFISQASFRGMTDVCKGKIQKAMDDGVDIAIYLDRMDMVMEDALELNSNFWFEFKYKCRTSNKYEMSGSNLYNVTACYKGVLKKKITHVKQVAAEYKATCSYVGLVRKVWYDYDGMAYYRGSVTKGNAVGNMNPEGDNEILMFSDKNGYLRRPVYVTDEEGNRELKNFYRVESDYVYITDVFKDNIACFYKYPLKKPLYDYRGPDSRGFYEGDAVNIFTASLGTIPSGYVHNMKLHVAEYENVERISDDFTIISKKVPMRYSADLYTSFISNSSDTFKVTYNAFDDNDKNNVALDNGVTEEIYNYPFMHEGTDFFLEPVDRKARVNKIKLPEPCFIEDTRRYVTFKYTITAERKSDGKTFTTVPRTASILNRDYALPAEHAMFDGRAMVISPESDGIKQSPFDMVLYDQAASKTETIIKPKDTGFLFYASITEIKDEDTGAVNIRCNPDGSGYVTAETTLDTGFWDGSGDEDGSASGYTKKLCFDSPYFIEDGRIYPGFKVKCIDTRYIKVMAPREEHLLQSWYPRLQFGHYTQILDQYGSHIKVCYTMPEYDTQHFSGIYGKPYVDVCKERVEILNPHMVRTKCFPLLVKEPSAGDDTYIFKDRIYKVIKKQLSWQDAQDECRKLGGNLAMPKTQELGEAIIDIATKYELSGLWLGGTDEETEGVWKWTDGTAMTYSCWNTDEPNNLGGVEHYLEVYTDNGKWNDLPGVKTEKVNGFICELDRFSTIKLYKRVGSELFALSVRDVSFSDGIIITSDAVSENDDIVCDYTYLEDSYVYRGFWRNKTDFARIDLNPNIYHTYSDLSYVPSETKPSKNLFNKIIYFFMKPTIGYQVSSEKDSLVFDLEDEDEPGEVLFENGECLYHKIDDDQPDDDKDLYIGSAYIRQNTSLHSTVLVDSRTRGGGVLESMKDSLRHELEPESDYYMDIGYYDGEPYQENGVIIIRLDNSLLKEFGGRFTHGEIEAKVKRWLGLGVYPVIEYVDAYAKKDMPQYSLTVEDSFTNVIDIIPEIYLEYTDTI